MKWRFNLDSFSRMMVLHIWSFVFLHCLVTVLVSCHEEPLPEIIEMTVPSTTQGMMGKIHCKYINSRKTSKVDWIKILGRTPLIITQGGQLKVSPQKYEIKESKVQENIDGKSVTVTIAMLHIKDLEENDSGKYRCTVRSSDFQVKQWPKREIDLRVTQGESPEISIETEGQGVTFKGDYLMTSEGNTFKVTCKASGSPTPTVKWVLDDQPEHVDINIDKGEMIFPKLQTDMMGRYVCVASNGVHPKAVRTIFIGVKSRVKCGNPRILTKSDFCDTDGGDVKLEFQTEGFPKPYLKFRRSGSSHQIVSDVRGETKKGNYSIKRSSQSWNKETFVVTVLGFVGQKDDQFSFEAINDHSSCIKSTTWKEICDSGDTDGQTGPRGSASLQYRYDFYYVLLALLSAIFTL